MLESSRIIGSELTARNAPSFRSDMIVQQARLGPEQVEVVTTANVSLDFRLSGADLARDPAAAAKGLRAAFADLALGYDKHLVYVTLNPGPASPGSDAAPAAGATARRRRARLSRRLLAGAAAPGTPPAAGASAPAQPGAGTWEDAARIEYTSLSPGDVLTLVNALELNCGPMGQGRPLPGARLCIFTAATASVALRAHWQLPFLEASRSARVGLVEQQYAGHRMTPPPAPLVVPVASAPRPARPLAPPPCAPARRSQLLGRAALPPGQGGRAARRARVWRRRHQAPEHLGRHTLCHRPHPGAGAGAGYHGGRGPGSKPVETGAPPRSAGAAHADWIVVCKSVQTVLGKRRPHGHGARAEPSAWPH